VPCYQIPCSPAIAHTKIRGVLVSLLAVLGLESAERACVAAAPIDTSSFDPN